MSKNSFMSNNIKKSIEFASWVIFYPDLFLDMLKPERGGITLNADQRIVLRMLTRFHSVYGCFPRGWSKTMLGIIAMFIVCIVYPRTGFALTAQTRESSAKLIKNKVREIFIFYPLFVNELAKEFKPTTDDAEVLFKNGSSIVNLANSQTSKGSRKERLVVEEAALLNNDLYNDVLEPVVEVPRMTSGVAAVNNPYELSGQINFLTTPAWKNSDEFNRNLRMIEGMSNLNGQMVVGADWRLACWYGRGSSKAKMMQRMRDMPKVSFDQNYGGTWTGAVDGALVNADDLIACMTIETPLFEREHMDDEYYIGVDVARSENSKNNQSYAVVVRVVREKSQNRITSLEVVHMLHISNNKNFTQQAIEVKKLKIAFGAKMVIVDGNVLGKGLIDELLKENKDTLTDTVYECWATVNTENIPEIKTADRIVYDFHAQGNQSDLIFIFSNYVQEGKLKLLRFKAEDEFSYSEKRNVKKNILPFAESMMLFHEITNLKAEASADGRTYRLVRVLRKIDKDRFSALAMALWYIHKFESIQKVTVNMDDMLSIISMSRSADLKSKNRLRFKPR